MSMFLYHTLFLEGGDRVRREGCWVGVYSVRGGIDGGTGVHYVLHGEKAEGSVSLHLGKEGGTRGVGGIHR